MKIAIAGQGGQLGSELRRQLTAGGCSLGPLPPAVAGAAVVGFDLPQLSITDLPALRAWMEAERPDVIINCSAFTNVDGCETQRDDAFAVNGLGPRNLAMVAEEIGAKLLHVSTDYVFSGADNGGLPLDETALPAPVSAYGATKLLGERYVQNFCHRWFIVRTAWLYGYAGKNFVKTIAAAARRHGTVTVVSDQLGNPTNAEDLAWHMLCLCDTEEYGLYHCTGEGVCSWYEFTCEILRLAGIAAQAKPCTSAEYKQLNPAATDRPAWSALENRMLACTIGNHMRPWQQALACFFETYREE